MIEAARAGSIHGFRHCRYKCDSYIGQIRDDYYIHECTIERRMDRDVTF